MPTLLNRGASWLADKLQAAGGVTVTYQRSGQSISLVGTPQKLDYEVPDDETGIPQTVTFYDWTFTDSELVFGTEAIESRPGDEIVRTLNGETLTYAVTSPGKRPLAEWMDTDGVMRTVHAKLVKRA